MTSITKHKTSLIIINSICFLLIITCCLFITTHSYANGRNVKNEDTMVDEKKVEEVPENPLAAPDTPNTNHYFKKADSKTFNLAQKIERKQDINVEEVKALPDGALNARYASEITFLFFALRQDNVQAIDVLLQAGADPYMVDRPQLESVKDFTYYITDAVTSGSVEETIKFRTALMKIYLKNDGDPNHEMPSRARTPLLVSAILMRNLEGARLLIDAGADPLKLNKGDLSGANMLAMRYDVESRKLLTYVVCIGTYDHADSESVDDIMSYLWPGGPENLELEALYKKIAIYILKRHPHYQDDLKTQDVFKGPIPWKMIMESDDRELCPSDANYQ